MSSEGMVPPAGTGKRQSARRNPGVGVIYSVGRLARIAVPFFHINHVVRANGMARAYNVEHQIAPGLIVVGYPWLATLTLECTCPIPEMHHPALSRHRLQAGIRRRVADACCRAGWLLPPY